MFKVNDLVIYGNEGVCRVDDICMIDMPSVDKNRLYYILKPLYFEGKIIYSPIDTNVFMRSIIAYETAQQLIEQIPDMKDEEYNNNSLRELNDYYKSLIETHRCEDLFHLIRTVYAKENNAAKNRRKLGQTDKNYMRIAEEMLYGEFAAALVIPKEDVKSYIEHRVGELERKN